MSSTAFTDDKGRWTAEEDNLIHQLVAVHGVKKWAEIGKHIKGRTGKQCRERYINHLKEGISNDPWTNEEDEVIIRCHSEEGQRWSEMARRLPGRTDNSIKNRWNSTLRKIKRQEEEAKSRGTARIIRRSDDGVLYRYICSTLSIVPPPVEEGGDQPCVPRQQQRRAAPATRRVLTRKRTTHTSQPPPSTLIPLPNINTAVNPIPPTSPLSVHSSTSYESSSASSSSAESESDVEMEDVDDQSHLVPAQLQQISFILRGLGQNSLAASMASLLQMESLCC